MVCQPALPAGGGAAGARGGAWQVPRDAHVRHLRPPTHRHESCRPPAGPRPDAREGEEGPGDRAEGSHKCRPTKLDKSFDQGPRDLENSLVPNLNVLNANFADPGREKRRSDSFLLRQPRCICFRLSSIVLL